MDELIRKLREQINARINLRNDYSTQLEELARADDVDETKIDELRAKKAGLDAEVTELRSRMETLEKEREADKAVERLQDQGTRTSTGEDTRERGGAVVTSEARTYRADTDPHGLKFARDVVSAFLGNQGANERLSRHMAEERVERGDGVMDSRSVITGDIPGTVIPQYLVDLYAPKSRPGRHLADQMTKHPLPDTGMTAYIPRQVTQTTVGDQATELTDVTEMEYEDELVPVAIRTAAGASSISRQAVERGAGIDDVVLKDAFGAYDTNLDSRLINTATKGLLAVANAVTYTDTDPTAGELYRKILQASANAEDVLQDSDPDDLFTLMRGRRWSWLQGELTDKWPFIAVNGFPALNGGTSNGSAYPSGVRGALPNGGPVVTDNNLPNNLGTGTDEDVIVAVLRSEAHLWEDSSAPRYIRAETGPSMKKLGIDLVVYGFFGFCFDRVVDEQGTPKAVHQKITGTGLVAPVF